MCFAVLRVCVQAKFCFGKSRYVYDKPLVGSDRFSGIFCACQEPGDLGFDFMFRMIERIVLCGFPWSAAVGYLVTCKRCTVVVL